MEKSECSGLRHSCDLLYARHRTCTLVGEFIRLLEPLNTSLESYNMHAPRYTKTLDRNAHPSQHPRRFKCSGRSIASRGRSFINSSATRSQSFACNTNMTRHVSVGCSAYYTIVSLPKSTTPPTECSDVYPGPTHVRILLACLQAADVFPISLSASASLVFERVHAVVVALGLVRRFFPCREGLVLTYLFEGCYGLEICERDSVGVLTQLGFGQVYGGGGGGAQG